MPYEMSVLGAGTLALLTSFGATPFAIALARRTEFYDRPGGYKAHARPTPYLGGLVVVFGWLVGTVVFTGALWRLAPIVIGVLLLCALGTLDDRVNVSRWLRILFEIGAAVALWASGLGWSLFASDIANLVLTTLWVLAVTNAFNLMDNLDGAASSVALVSAAGASVLALVGGDAAVAVVAVALVGACAGFLPYNLASPARIFLGDGGSLPIGFVVAAVIMAAEPASEPGALALITAIVLVGLPALDTTMVFVSRWRRGLPLLAGGRDHLTHRSLRRLGSPRAVALALGALQCALCVIAIAAHLLAPAAIAVIGALYLAGIAIATYVLDGPAWAPTPADAAAPPLAALRAAPPR